MPVDVQMRRCGDGNHFIVNLFNFFTANFKSSLVLFDYVAVKLCNIHFILRSLMDTCVVKYNEVIFVSAKLSI